MEVVTVPRAEVLQLLRRDYSRDHGCVIPDAELFVHACRSITGLQEEVCHSPVFQDYELFVAGGPVPDYIKVTLSAIAHAQK